MSATPKISKDGKEFTITIKLYDSDLGYVARMRTEEDGKELRTADLLELWSGLTSGEVNRHVPEGVERYDNDPDYDAFSEFCFAIQQIRDTMPAMLLIAASASDGE